MAEVKPNWFIYDKFTCTVEPCFDCHGKGCSRCKSTGVINVWRNKAGEICFTNLSQNDQMGDKE